MAKTDTFYQTIYKSPGQSSLRHYTDRKLWSEIQYTNSNTINI